MCIVQPVQTKSVFSFQPTEYPVFTTVESAKPVLTWLKLLLSTKNRQLCCLVVMVHIALQKIRVATMKKEIHLRF